MRIDLQAIEDRENEKRLERDLKGVYRTRVLEKMPRYRFIEFSKNGNTAALRMMATVGGEAHRTLMKLEDGTLSDSWEPEPPGRQSLSLHVRYDDLMEEMIEETARMLTAEALEDMGMAGYARTCRGQHRGGEITMDRNARAMVLERGSLCLMPSGERRVRWKDVYAETNRLIRKHLQDPDARALAETLSGSHRDITAAQYNRALRGGTGLWKLVWTEPGLAGIYFRHIMGPDDPERTPEDIARRVRETWELSGEELTALSRVARRPGHIDTRDNPDRARREMTALARALVITGADPDSPDGRGILQHSGTTVMMAQAGEEIFRKWLRVLPGVLEEERRTWGQYMGNRPHSPFDTVRARAERMLREKNNQGALHNK